MRLLTVHLSDIHVKTGSEPVLDRAAKISAAVRNISYDVDACLVLITGDIAFSGTQSQYSAFSGFVIELKEKLSEDLRRDGNDVPVYLVTIPGNHDCDFSEKQTARDLLIDAAIAKPALLQDSSIISQLSEVQDPFFEFLELLNDPWARTAKDAKERWLHWVEFRVGTECVRIARCNTACASRLREQPGKLAFPIEMLPNDRQEDVLTIALFHHPPGWLEPNVSREMLRRVEAFADIVFTGHEHVSARHNRQAEDNEPNYFVEGGVLFEGSEPDHSTFNAILIDTAAMRQTFVRLSWTGEVYLPVASDGAPLETYPAAEPLAIHKLRAAREFKLSERHATWLNDPGVELAHGRKERLALDDIFVFPHVREVPTLPTNTSTILESEKLLELAKNHGIVLVTGDSQCGKTALAKRLFLRAYSDGDVPLLLRGTEARIKSGDALFRQLDQLYAEQYRPSSGAALQQVGASRRVLLVDDFDEIAVPRGDKAAFCKELTRYASRVILLANGLHQDINELIRPGAALAMPHYSIMPLGYARRGTLVDKWINLGATDETDAAELARRYNAVNRTLDAMFQNNYIAPMPVYVLSVLQAAEAATAVDTKASTHGYFYELLVRIALSKAFTKDYDIMASYLAHLCYRAFKDRKSTVTSRWLEATHKQYVETYDIEREFKATSELLISSGVLRPDEGGGGYKFKYRYVYHYFVAAYIRDNLSVSEVREDVRKLSQSLHVDEAANILLFLAHLSKDPLIVDAMLEAAEQSFAELEPAKFGEDLAFLLELQQGPPADISYEDRPLEIVRREIEEACDALDSLPPSPEPESTQAVGEELKTIARFTRAVKSMQILGQVLKNFPGSLQGERKIQLALACYALAMRTAAAFFKIIQENETTMVTEIERFLRDRKSGITADRAMKRARQALAALVELFSFSIVARLAQAVGSRELFPTFDRITAKLPDSIAAKLMTLAIRLDHGGDFPEDEVHALDEELPSGSLPARLLRLFVVQHFYFFPVKLAVKQRTCIKLKVPFSGHQVTSPARQLVTLKR